ncbi:MAG: deoxyuridine 5'-triphosphate nucleotidohydrolase [Chloroflexota bacterium]|nr:deoxyuridine 5'-triphosphate nucleotidohydrolase [Chloroflexota bacterium]
MGALSSTSIRALCAADTPLLRGYQDFEAQLQPNGFDLTLEAISRHSGPGSVGISNNDRVLPDLIPLPFDGDGWAELEPGVYHVTFNEVVALPLDLMALGRPRSTLCRMGAAIHTAVWDAGYEGRSSSLLAVSNREGIRLQKNARILQLVFLGVSNPPAEGYSGIYQGENVNR